MGSQVGQPNRSTKEEDAQMTHAERMLQTNPSGAMVGAGTLVECIEACFDCAQACMACADACFGEEGHAQHIAHGLAVSITAPASPAAPPPE